MVRIKAVQKILDLLVLYGTQKWITNRKVLLLVVVLVLLQSVQKILDFPANSNENNIDTDKILAKTQSNGILLKEGGQQNS